MAFIRSRRVGLVALIVAGAFAVATFIQPTKADAGNNAGGIAAGLIGGAMIAIIASQAAQANKGPAERQPPRKKQTKTPTTPKAVAQTQAQPQAQRQVVQPTPPPMNSDPFKGVAPAVVPSSSARPVSF